jgi:hypothetical protein
MPQSQISNAATIISILLVVLGGCFGVISTLFFLVLKRIKSSIDKLWTKRDADHDRITIIEAKCNAKNGKT